FGLIGGIIFQRGWVWISQKFTSKSSVKSVLERESKSDIRDLDEFSTQIKQDYDPRSEEHTSELQSRENLVCRLLLEKKKLHTNTLLGAVHHPETVKYARQPHRHAPADGAIEHRRITTAHY